MKNILFILFFIAFAGVKSNLFAQTEKELLIRLMDKQDRLSDKQDKMLEQMAAMDKRLSEQMAAMDKRLSERIAVVETKTDGLQKQFDIISTFLAGMLGIIGVFVGVIMWDRRTALKPLDAKFDKSTEQTAELKAEIAIFKEKQVKAEIEISVLKEKGVKADMIFREIARIDNRFAEIFKNAGIA